MISFTPNFSGSLQDHDIYYQVGDIKTHSKFEAMLLANNDPDKIKFSYMDEFWSRQCWTQEPKESIQELISRRCCQLREKSNYIALWLSGGYDSQTILDYFISNQIKVDEIITYRRRYLKSWEASAEFDAALEQARNLKKYLWPDLKIVEVNLEPDDLLTYYRFYKKNWILQPGTQLTITKSIPAFMYNFNWYVKKVFDIPGRLDIEGREKPRLWIEDGKWYTTYYDVLTDWQSNSGSTSFYTTHELPQLQIKQTWMMINWLESLPIFDIKSMHIFLHELQSLKKSPEMYAQWNFAIGRNPVKSLGSYVTTVAGAKVWHHGDVTCTKESTPVLDHFKNAETDVYNIYTEGIAEIKKVCSNLFNESGGVRMIKSMNHYIKPVEPGRLFDPTKHISLL